MLNDYVLAGVPPELASRSDLVRDGVMLKDPVSKLVVGHMKPLLQVPAQLIQQMGSLSSIVNLGVSVATFAYMRSQFNALNSRLDQIDNKLDVMDQKLDVLIGAVRRVERKVDAVAKMQMTLLSRIDARHRDDVFAEIGAVLDTLAYADKKSSTDASAMVSSNITPARKAIRRFNALVDEYEQAIGGGLELIETTRMRLLSGMLSIKLDLAMGEVEAARDVALEVSQHLSSRGGALLTNFLTETPFTKLGRSLNPTGLAEFCDVLEVIDGVPLQERLLQSISSALDVAEVPSLDVGQEYRRFYMNFEEKKGKKPSWTLSPGDSLGGGMNLFDLMGEKSIDWQIELPLRYKVGDRVSKGDLLARVVGMRKTQGRANKKVAMATAAYAELLSPVDGILEAVLEDLTEANKDITQYTDLFRLTPTEDDKVKGAQAPAETVAVGKINRLDADMERIAVLSKLVACAKGMALETALLTADPANHNRMLLAEPFSQDYVLLPMEDETMSSPTMPRVQHIRTQSENVC